MYGINTSSDAISRDTNSLLYSSTFKHPSPHANIISPHPYPNFDHQNQNQNQNQLHRSSLQRYRSTPTSFFSNLLTGDDHFTDERFLLSKESESSDARVPYAPSSDDGGYRSGTSDVDSMIVRQKKSTTPDGFLSALNVENGFARVNKGSSSSTLNNHVGFSLGPSSSPSRFRPEITENKNELHDSKFSSLKRNRDGALKMPQNAETGNHTPPNLVHHMSLPKTSSEMAVVENFLQFQQESTVPLRTRAKRGFATHPRSIAERVRRTRISERIKRLQELFPNIDKQSNTADMLDMAVEYIKNLQKELQTLNDARARCKCSSKQ